MKTWYMGSSRTSCSTAGRQPEAGLTPRSLYSCICCSEILARSPLYLVWIAFSSGCSICMRRCETICMRKTGMISDAEDDGQQDDGDADVAGDAVEEGQADEDDLEDGREDPGQQGQRVGAIGLRRAQVRLGRLGRVGVRAWRRGRAWAWARRGRRSSEAPGARVARAGLGRSESARRWRRARRWRGRARFGRGRGGAGRAWHAATAGSGVARRLDRDRGGWARGWRPARRPARR